jgi:hypothetical protein
VGSFEDFVAATRGVVEAEAREHADDRWWIFEPRLVVERREVRALPLAECEPALRALRSVGLAGLPEALSARRVAIAFHADVSLRGDITPVIVLAVAGLLVTALEHARVKRTEFGTPWLGPWEPSDLDQAAVEAAVGAALG